MKTNYSFLKFVKSLILLVSLTFCNISNATEYYMIATNGNWNANTTWSLSSNGPAVGVGVYPGAGDVVIIDGSVQRNLFINISNAQCASIKNQMTATDGSTFTLSITGTNILTVSGDFDITGSTNYSRTTTLTGTGTLSVGGNINVGSQGLIPIDAKYNVLNLNGPNILCNGNVNLFNIINGTGNYNASSINHSQGKLSLLGTGLNGYLITNQNEPGIPDGNRYTLLEGQAEIEFYHVGDCPITYDQITNIPIFSGIGSKVIYSGSSINSVVLGTTYYNLTLNNSSGHTINATLNITNQFNLISGNLNIGSNVFNMNNNTTMNISSGSGVTATTSTYFRYLGDIDINYSGNVTAAGVELRSGNNFTTTNTITNQYKTRIRNLTISGTTNFNLGTSVQRLSTNGTYTSLFILNSLTINDNNFTCNIPTIECPKIEINGGIVNNLTINSILKSTNTTGGITISGKNINLNQTLSATGNGNFISINPTNTLTFNNSITSGGNIDIIANSIIANTTSSTLSGSRITTNTVGNSSFYNTTATGSNGITMTASNINLNGPLSSTTGPISLSGDVTATAAGTLNGTSISILSSGTDNLYNLTASGSNGINLTASNLNLNGPLSSPSGPISLSGDVTATAAGTLNGGSITIMGSGINTLYNLTASGSNGINLTASNLNLNGPLSSPSGPISLSGDVTATAAGTLNGGSITIMGSGINTLYNLTASGSNGINLTGNTIELKAPLIATNGSIILNGTTNTIINATLNAKTIEINGNNNVFNGKISANDPTSGIFINGSSIFNSNINTNEEIINSLKITIENNANCIINSDLTTDEMTIKSNTEFNNDLLIVNNLLTLEADILNTGIISAYNLNIADNTSLNNNNTSGSIYILNELSVNSGKVLETGGVLILYSNENLTARVGEIENNAIIGDVTVQRYLINSERKWRLLTAPVKGNTNNSIFSNWQNNGVIDGISGTDVWGPNTNYNPNTNGMYYVTPSTHNFRKYNNGSWSSVTNTFNEPLFDSSRNYPFLTFIIFPYGSGINGQGQQGVEGSGNTTLSAKGNLLTGTQTYQLTSGNYELIGNPYASPIDMESLIISSGINSDVVEEKIWIIDPLIGTYGGYVTWDPVGGYNASCLNLNEGNFLIQSGQAFFVKTKSNPTNNTFTINESFKRTGNNNIVFGRNNNTVFERLRVNLEKIENNTIKYKDGCVVSFYDGASNSVDGKDVEKFTNPEETLSFLNGISNLSSEHRAPIVNGDELILKLTRAVNGIYKIKINTENFTFFGGALFYDLKLGTITNMPLDGSIFEYPFEVTTDPTTQGARFKIVFTTTLSIDDNNIWNISAYPNPTSKNSGINVNLGTLDFGNYTYRVINMLGQEIQKGNLNKFENNQEFKIDFTTAINSGIYSFEVVNNNKTIKTIKLVIK